MKKIFAYALTVAAAAGLWACSSEEPAPAGAYDGTLTLTVNLPKQVESRGLATFGDGTKARTLTCLIYTVQANGTPDFASAQEGSFTNLTSTVTLKVATGTAYKVILWAGKTKPEYPNSTNSSIPFKFSADGTLTVTYSRMTNSNGSSTDDYDAFINTVNISANGEVTDQAGTAITGAVELRRPFAQLNIASDDTMNGMVQAKFGSDIYTYASISNLATTYNPWTKESSGSTNVEFPATKNSTSRNNLIGDYFSIDNKNYYSLATLYLLVPANTASTGNALCPVSLTFGTSATTKDGGTVNIGNCPLRRNYKTNVYGSLLTSGPTLTVSIVPTPDGTEDNPYPTPAGQ